MTANLASPMPLAAPDRLPALDILRGVALLGIFIMNMPSFSASLFALHENGWTGLLRDLLVAGKFNALLALLFGIGFALQMRRLDAGPPGHAVRIYLRRLLVLMALGLVHAAFFWSGDVLFVYAVLGLALLGVRRLPDAALLGLIGAGVLFPSFAVYLRAALMSMQTEGLAMLDYQALEASNNLAYGAGSFADTVRENQRMLAWAWGTPLGLWSMATFFVQMGTPLLLGYFIGRRGWVSRLGELRAPMRRWRGVALGIGLCASLAFLLAGVDSQEPTATSALLNGLETLGRLALMLFYALSVALLAQEPRWREALAPLAAVGRMPLTNYLLQTALATSIFYGWGLCWWGRAGTGTQIGMALALFAGVQVPLSMLWLRRFERGPLEQLWRLTTYGRRPARELPAP